MRHEQLYSLVNRRQRRQAGAARSVRRRLGRFAFGCAAVAMLALVGGLLAAGFFYTGLTENIPAVERVPVLLDPLNGPLLQPTRLYDRSGQVLLLSLENPGVQRRYLSIDPNLADHISPELLRVSVALIEPGYWQGPGFDLRRLTSLQPETIAERLALDLLLWQEPAGLRRALRMRLLAAQLVDTYGRAQVLEWYLNSAYYGHLAYGIESAARLYLDRPASQVDLPGAALLSAANRAPALNALDAPEAALQRQKEALDELLELGVISSEEHQRAYDQPLALQPQAPEPVLPAGGFANLAVDQLAARFGRQRIERGGLRVITTLDYALQREMACLARTQLERIDGGQAEGESGQPRLPDGAPCQAARLLPTLPTVDSAGEAAASAVILDPRTGEVLALLGDTNLAGEGQRLSARPPGSLLTPFVAVAGFARGYGPASLGWDIPTTLPEGVTGLDGPLDNPSGDFHGPVRLRMALANDYLAPFTQLLQQIGASNVWRLGSALGLPGLANATDPALIYGLGRLSPLEIAQAYGIFAAQGTFTGQFGPDGNLSSSLVTYVEDVVSGEVLFDARQPESQAVLSEPLAYLLHHVLSDSVARRPSLGYPNLLEIGRPAGAKIGQVVTAGEGPQGWAAGYTRQRVAVFWLGLEDAPEGQALDPRAAAGMWHAAMQYMHRDLPVEDWPEPPGISRVEVCDPSGQLPTDVCPNVVSEVFLTGNEPTALDNLYRSFEINRETGRLATVFTPAVLIEEKIYMVAPLEARAWAQAAGLPLPPEDYDAIQPPALSPEVHFTDPESFAYVRGQITLTGSAGGDGFRFYQLQAGQGLNPGSWLQIIEGSRPVTGGELGVWDTTGLDGLYAIRLLVVREDQSVETAVIQVTVDNKSPLVRVLYPVAGQTISDPDERQSQNTRAVTFQADVSDSVRVARVVWLVDGRVVGETRHAPYVFTWQGGRGEHTLQVKAYDPAENEGVSEEVPFTLE